MQQVEQGGAVGLAERRQHLGVQLLDHRAGSREERGSGTRQGHQPAPAVLGAGSALDQTARQALAAEEQKKREAAEKDPLIQRIKSIRIEDDNSEAIKRLSKKISDAKLSG